jgi:hypothetical protein
MGFGVAIVGQTSIVSPKVLLECVRGSEDRDKSLAAGMSARFGSRGRLGEVAVIISRNQESE